MVSFGVGFDDFAGFETIHFRHHHIANDEVWDVLAGYFYTYSSVFGFQHFVVVGYCRFDVGADVGVVFDDQYN